MGDRGLVYIPTKCQKQPCALLVALHGCGQSLDQANFTFATHSGFNEWAEGNGVVVLYPNVKTSWSNPNACWDWWGYTGANYLDKRGPQIRAIVSMVYELMNHQSVNPAIEFTKRPF